MAINTKITQDHIYHSKAFMSFSTSRQPRVMPGLYELLEPSSFLIPKELWCNVFRFLSPKDLYCGAALTCRRCHIVSQSDCLLLGFSLDQLFPSLRIIGPETWKKEVDLKKFGLDVTDAPNYDTLEVRRQLIQLYAPGVILDDPVILKDTKKVRNNPGATILTIPKGLSCDNLNKIRDFFCVSYRPYHIKDLWKDTFRYKTVENTYNVIFTNNYLATPQQGLKPGEKIKISSELDCVIPDPLSGVTFITFTAFYYRMPYRPSLLDRVCPLMYSCPFYDIDDGRSYTLTYYDSDTVTVQPATKKEVNEGYWADDIIAMCRCAEPKSINPKK
jgi:hypothetical protein